MNNRRWWNGPRLRQWKLMVECGDYQGCFAAFPCVVEGFGSHAPTLPMRWSKTILPHGTAWTGVLMRTKEDALSY